MARHLARAYGAPEESHDTLLMHWAEGNDVEKDVVKRTLSGMWLVDASTAEGCARNEIEDVLKVLLRFRRSFARAKTPDWICPGLVAIYLLQEYVRRVGLPVPRWLCDPLSEETEEGRMENTLIGEFADWVSWKVGGPTQRENK